MSRAVFGAIVLALAFQRLLELRLSRRNEALLRRQGGREHARGHLKAIVLLHASWFAAMLLEVFALNRRVLAPLAGIAATVFMLGQALRYSAIRALGPHWTVSVMTVPGERPVVAGPYRHIRHPNYLGVILELLAVPLLHGAYLTALIFTLANFLLLRVRIRAEEAALNEAGNYSRAFADRPRFIPGFF